MEIHDMDDYTLNLSLKYGKYRYKAGYEQGKKDAVKHGHWIEDIDLLCHIRCSECDNGIDWRNAKKPNYCPNCGAKMDGDKND